MLYYLLAIGHHYIYLTKIDMTKTTCIQFFKPAANFNSKQRAAHPGWNPSLRKGNSNIFYMQILPEFLSFLQRSGKDARFRSR